MVFKEAMRKYDAKMPWQAMEVGAHCAAAVWRIEYRSV